MCTEIYIQLLLIFILIFTIITLIWAKSQSNTIHSENFEKKALLVVSIGDNRPFFNIMKNHYQHYANKIGADLVVKQYTSIPKEYLKKIDFYKPEFKENSEKFRRRLMKMIFLREILENYDRVLLMDDSCFIMPETPNLFDLVPSDTIGAVKDLGLLGSLNGNDCINTGVMVVSKEQYPFFKDFEKYYHECNLAIKENKFKWVGVDQSVINYAIQKKILKVTFLDPVFNVVTTLITNELMEKKQAYIFNLTGTFENLKLKRANFLVKNNPIPMV